MVGVASTSTQVIPVSDCPGVSVDSEFVHFQWRASHEELKTVQNDIHLRMNHDG
jgi:alkyl hydroperoxide reductase subunit AhpC